MGKENNQKGNSLLPLKILHKFHLMLMNVLKRKGVAVTLLGSEADRDALNCPDVIHRTFLIEICQRNMAALLINFDRRNRRRTLLNQREPLLSVFFIGPVDQILQRGTAEAP